MWSRWSWARGARAHRARSAPSGTWCTSPTSHFTRTLGLGETLTLEYWTSYHYPGDPADPADPAELEYRRAVMGTLENIRHADRVSPRSAAHRGLGRDGRTGAGPGAGQPGQPALGAPL